MPGPPPDKNAQRRNAGSGNGFRLIPSEGRKKRSAPPWPLPADVAEQALVEHLRDEIASCWDELDDPLSKAKPGPLKAKINRLELRVKVTEARMKTVSDLERTIWRALWKTPQAVIWEQHRWTRTVGLFARLQAKAELGSLPSAVEARQISDRIGLHPLALLRLRLEIAPDQVGAQRQAATPTAGLPSRMERVLSAVPDAGGQ